MHKYLGELDRILYSAEIACPNNKDRLASLHTGWSYRCDIVKCPFTSEHQRCRLTGLRIHIGDHVKQDDVVRGWEP